MYELWYQLLFDNVRHDLLELSHYNSYMWISLCGNRGSLQYGTCFIPALRLMATSREALPLGG